MSLAAPFGTRADVLPKTGVSVLLAFCVLAGAAVLQWRSETNTDVSWAFTLGERWLAGEKPYVDFVEVNPPATLLIYMPMLLLAHWLGISPEAVLVPAVLAAALASAGATSRLLRASKLSPGGPVAFVAICAVLTLLPMGDFGEREHLATIAILPLLAVVAGRTVGFNVSTSTGILAGAVAGLALAVKPMFGLALLGPLLLLASRRGWRAPFGEPGLYAAAAVPALYGAAVPLFFPAFTADILQQVLAVYVPVRQSLTILLIAPVTFAGVGLSVLALLTKGKGQSATWPNVLLLAALGFGGSYILQGKAWAYQALPAVSLALLAASGGVVRMPWHRSALVRTAATWSAGAVFAGCAAVAFATHPTMGAAIPGLKRAIAGSRPQPSMMAMTSDIAVGHPLVRDLGGRWIGSYPSEWITGNVDKLKAAGVSNAQAGALDAFSQGEQARVAADLEVKKPDVVLVQGERWSRYIAGNARLRALMGDYKPQGVFGGVTLWIRIGQGARGVESRATPGDAP